MFFSCSPRSKKKDENELEIIIPFGEEKRTALSTDWFSELTIIPLETTNQSLMNVNVNSKLLYYKNRFYILDRKQHVVFIFDENGKFLLSSKDKEGQGPGEYFSLIDFDINTEKDLIEILDIFCIYTE